MSHNARSELLNVNLFVWNTQMIGYKKREPCGYQSFIWSQLRSQHISHNHEVSGEYFEIMSSIITNNQSTVHFNVDFPGTGGSTGTSVRLVVSEDNVCTPLVVQMGSPLGTSLTWGSPFNMSNRLRLVLVHPLSTRPPVVLMSSCLIGNSHVIPTVWAYVHYLLLHVTCPCFNVVLSCLVIVPSCLNKLYLSF